MNKGSVTAESGHAGKGQREGNRDQEGKRRKEGGKRRQLTVENREEKSSYLSRERQCSSAHLSPLHYEVGSQRKSPNCIFPRGKKAPGDTCGLPQQPWPYFSSGLSEPVAP